MEQIFHFLAFYGRFYLENLAKIKKTANFSPKNGYKMPKNQKIKNLFHMILDFSGKKLLTKFGGQ